MSTPPSRLSSFPPGIFKIEASAVAPGQSVTLEAPRVASGSLLTAEIKRADGSGRVLVASVPPAPDSASRDITQLSKALSRLSIIGADNPTLVTLFRPSQGNGKETAEAIEEVLDSLGFAHVRTRRYTDRQGRLPNAAVSASGQPDVPSIHTMGENSFSLGFFEGVRSQSEVISR